MAGFYTRAKFEEDLKMVDELRLEGTRALLRGAINGFEKRKVDAECEDFIRIFERKLAVTRLILSDREAMSKSMWFAFVIARKTKPWLMRRGSKQWNLTTPDEVEQLKARGVTVIIERGYSKNKASDPALLDLDATIEYAFDWKPCTVAEAREYAQAGDWKIGKDGKKEFNAYYLVRFVGEPPHTSGEFIDIRNAAAIGAEETSNREVKLESSAPPLTMAAKAGSL